MRADNRDRTKLNDMKAAAKARIAELCRLILPPAGAYVWKGYYFSLNPGRADRHVGSFFVWLSGDAAGGWRDMATGEQGDVIDLVALALSLDRGGAIRWLMDWTGTGQLSRRELEAARARWRQQQADAERAAAEELEAQRRRAKGLWLACRPLEPPADGAPPSPAWAYLTRARAIDFSAFGRVPSLLRWSPGLRHTDSGQVLPCLVAGIVDAAGKLTGVHRTWLAPDGSGKADVSPPRKVWPRGIAGGVIWLSRGASSLGPVEAGRRGERGLVIYGEGVEDGLTAAMGDPTARTAAALSLANLGALPDMACADAYLVLRDNDWGKPDAAARFDSAIARMRSWGKPVDWIASPYGKDFNDLARAIARGLL